MFRREPIVQELNCRLEENVPSDTNTDPERQVRNPQSRHEGRHQQASTEDYGSG